MSIPLPLAPLRAWVLNGTWDPNFVLASTDMIAAENRVATLLGALPSEDGTCAFLQSISALLFDS